MIVVVGRPDAAAVRTLAGAIVAGGGRCEIVGAVRPDATGDAVLRALASAGAGHAAVLRTPASDLDAADLELALRYLPDPRVVILLGQDGLADVAAAVTSWSGAALVLVTSTAPEAGLPSGDRTIVLAPPAGDPDGAFAGLVAELALRLDAGDGLASAWPATLERLVVEPAADSGSG